MSTTGIEVIIGAAAVAGSWVGAALIMAFRSGGLTARLTALENRVDSMDVKLDHRLEGMATKEQLAGVKEDIAEIKGMFRMTLRDGTDGAH